MDDDEFRRHYRLSKNIVRWLCDELRDDAALRRQRRARTVMTVEQQVLCALRFYTPGSYQGQVASDRHLAVHQTTVSACVRAVATAIVRHLGPRWIAFPEAAEEQAATQVAFLRHGSLPGVVGCVDGTFVAIKAPSKYDPTVTKALYWCRKLYYALNNLVTLYRDPRSPELKVAGLSILPSDLILPHWNSYLKHSRPYTCDARMDNTSHLERQWLYSSSQVELWNYYDGGDNLRTTNHAEGWHSSLKLKFKSQPRMPLGKFMVKYQRFIHH
ncbi:hypothetical protein HPB47_000756 [Ixodes persulcatus]|uniref:Uncharacterized protein n=1 Tax=Ixodes persulcatus TaxID=34615 RepID=A0AC60PSW9_IXOPE|nr:hypothetical protein HPB47_000756 [Ixodes persulcatus]